MALIADEGRYQLPYMVVLLSSLQLCGRVEPFFGMGKLELVTFLVDKVDGSMGKLVKGEAWIRIYLIVMAL